MDPRRIIPPAPPRARHKENKGRAFFESRPLSFLPRTQFSAQWKITVDNDYTLLQNREWDQKQKHKKQPWSNVECFALGGATVRFASLETSSHAANHTITPPPSYEGIPHCTNDKNRSPFHGEKTPDDNMISWKEIVPNLPKRFFMVSSRYFAFATND